MTSLLDCLALLEKSADAAAIVDFSLDKPQNGVSCSLWTYRRLYEAIVRVADDLKREGVQKESVVALALPNSIEYVVCFVAIGHLGAIAAPLNPSYRPSEFSFYMNDAGATYLIVNNDGNAAAESAANSCTQNRIEVLSCTIESPASDSARPRVASKNSSTSNLQKEHSQRGSEIQNFLDAYHMLIHTSGTTSKPKAVPLTHRNLIATVQNIVRVYELSPQDKTLLVMPLFHVHGLLCGLLASLRSGGTIIIPANQGKFSASQFWNDVCKWKVTWFTAVPTILQVLLARAEKEFPPKGSDVPSLRFIRSCSAALPASIVPQLEKTFKAPVLEAYAMSEAAHMICSNPLPSNGVRKPGSVGPPQNVELAILEPGSSIPLGPEQSGEVGIRGENVISGYLNNPEANADAFRDGWFLTGDLGRVDKDGYLVLVGRKKELINRGGEKISPAEVDDCLLQHPSVSEAVTFGAPDPKYGEIVCCALVLKTSSADVTPAGIQDFCKKHLAEFKIPQRVFICNEGLPKTATGKVQRRLIAAHFLQS